MEEPSTSLKRTFDSLYERDETPIDKNTLQNDSNEEKTEESQEPDAKKIKFSRVVANHYNELENTGVDVRKGSEIYYLRNFNNWMKSVLIKMYLNKLDRPENVLDLCCGKGGDLLKWSHGRIRHLICADIAWKSVQQCESRYNDLCKRSHNIFSCEFITADCTRDCLWEKFKNPDVELDLVSCQFSFHYCFESLSQARCMLKNASKRLKIGGYFIGTIPSANEIVKRIRKSGLKVLKNKVFSIKMCLDEPYPIFGAQYHFQLDSVVECPEFLVHFPTLVKLAGEVGLSLDYRSSFPDFYNNYNNCDNNKFLLKKMSSLEPFSIRDDKSSCEYEYARKYCRDRGYTGTLGTISQSEWEAISMYQVFAFVKTKNV